VARRAPRERAEDGDFRPFRRILARPAAWTGCSALSKTASAKVILDKSDFGAPCGAGFQYVSVRTGRPKQRVNGAKRSKFVRPSRLTKSSMTVVDAPSEGPATASMQLDSQRRQPHHPVKKDGFGVNIAHPLIREHRPSPGARK
jgi:hypothetical protein